MLPREKFQIFGIDSLKDSDLVAILVGSGIKGKDFKSISKSIISKFKKVLEEGRDIQLEDLEGVEGVGNVTAMRILSGIELGRRLYGIQDVSKMVAMNSKQAYAILKDIGGKKKEYIVALFLNSRFEVIKRKTICIGSLDGVGIMPRDVLIPALECNCAYVVLAHNHPSGDATPSREDIVVTQRMSEAFSLVGLELLDHLVITSKDWKSVEVG